MCKYTNAGNQIFHYMQVLIPVRGSKCKGQVHSIASVRNGKWELDKVVLEIKDMRPYIILDTKRAN